MTRDHGPEPLIEWRAAFSNDELNALHAEGFGHAVVTDDWWAQVNRHSLGWVCMRHRTRLTGFVNLAWDGGVHAFLLDTLVAEDMRRQGWGVRIVKLAVEQAARSGCEWLHVDYEPHLRAFYEQGCGFSATHAGLIALR